MKCKECDTELVWSFSRDIKYKNERDEEESEFSSFFTFTCPECQSSVELYNPK